MDEKDAKMNTTYQKRDNGWFKYLLQKDTGPYEHSDKEGERYDILIDRQLKVRVLEQIIQNTLISCGIQGEILNVRYQRLNSKNNTTTRG